MTQQNSSGSHDSVTSIPTSGDAIAHRRKRVIRIGRIGLTIVVALFLLHKYVIHHYWFARPMGEGSAGPPVARIPFERSWTDQPVMLLGLGDSVTAGFGASRAELTYFARVVQNPAGDFADLERLSLTHVIPKLEKRNLAVSGSNSIQLAAVVESLPVHAHDVFGLVVMTTGGNDLIHWYGRTKPKEGAMYGATLPEAQPWISAFDERLNKIVTLIPQKFPGGCHIFLGDIYDPTDGVGDAPSVFLPHWADGLAIHTAYNEVIRRCADQHPHVDLVPIHATFLGHGSHCTQFWSRHYCSADPHYWYYSNIEDPNDRGYDALRRIFLNEIARVVPRLFADR